MYRLENPKDAYELGLFDAFEDAICVIEWPEKLGSLLPKKIYKIDSPTPDKGIMPSVRKLKLTRRYDGLGR